MEFLSSGFFSALLAIIVIDLMLAGDNALVIGLAARRLPKEMQKKVILWGTAAAVIVRAIATVFVVWLLKIPGLLLVGGVLLLWIAYKLLVDEKGHGDVVASTTIGQAIRTILIADVLMGLDNVLAVAGAAHGDWLLVILGLVISVPIMVWGSGLVIKGVERWPWLLYVGSGVLAWTASKMIVDEKFIAPYFADPLLQYGFMLLAIAGVLTAGWLVGRRRKSSATT